MNGEGAVRQEDTAGNGDVRGSTPPGRRPLTPSELHEQRVKWGREYGKVMSEIKRARERRG